jgi:hypothetical protein
MLEIYIVILDHGSPDFALLLMVFAIWHIVLEIFSEEIDFFKQVNAQFLLCIYRKLLFDCKQRDWPFYIPIQFVIHSHQVKLLRSQLPFHTVGNLFLVIII